MKIKLKKPYGTKPIGSEIDAAVKQDLSEAFFYDELHSYFVLAEDFELSAANGATFTYSESSEPVIATILDVLGGDDITSAHGYAVAMMNTARRESKSSAPATTIWLPKVKRL